MEIVAILAVVAIVAVIGWHVYNRREDEVTKEQPIVTVAEVEEQSAVKKIYEQPTRSEASEVYAQPTSPASAVAEKPVEKKTRKPRAKKEPKVAVAAPWPFPAEKKGRRRRKDAQ